MPGWFNFASMRRFLFALILMLPAASWAAAPVSVDNLLAQLRRAETAEEAKPLETQILAAFLDSGSPSIDVLMSRSEAALAAGNKPVARHLLDEVTAIAPNFAEGWHRRALLAKASGEDGAAMLALQKAIQLNPKHFAAMAELAEMLEDFGQKADALKLYRRALALDPYFEGLDRHIAALSRDVEGQGI